MVTDPKKAAGALQWAVFEMMKRYKTFSEHGVKKLEEFNKLARATEGMETMPAVVVVIDELADLMLVAAKEVEESICRVAQMGRAGWCASGDRHPASLCRRHHRPDEGQYPQPDCLCRGLLSGVPHHSGHHRRGKAGGQGRYALCPLGAGKPTRVQGCFISRRRSWPPWCVVKQSGEAQYSDEVIAKIERVIEEKEKEKGGKGVLPLPPMLAGRLGGRAASPPPWRWWWRRTRPLFPCCSGG